jgi:hypothetical protein
LFAVLALAFVSNVARAQPAMTAPIAPLAAPMSDDDESPATALMLSIAGNVVPTVALVAGSHANSDGLLWFSAIGSLLLPSMGHWYAGDYLTPGLGIRAAGVVLAGLGSSAVFDSCASSCGSAAGYAGILAGVTLFIAGAVYDGVTAGDAARSYNTKHHLQLAPTMVNDGMHSNVGLGLGGTF